MLKTQNKRDLDANFDSLLPCDIDSVKLKIIDLAREAWGQEIVTKPKLRTYRTFKVTFATENYVIKDISRRKRSLLRQLRIGILPLRIEKGRFRNLPVEERVCEICGNGDIEDEKHFVCGCQEYQDLRNMLYSKATDKQNEFPNMDTNAKFNYLVSDMWRDVATFINDAWCRRSNILYT